MTRILVVEDDEAIRDTLCQLIDEEGYEPLPAAHGADALDILARNGERPSLILLDVMMPTMDGPTFKRRLDNEPRFAGIPVVVISAHASGRAAAEAIAADAYLRKPLDLDALLDVFERYCGGAANA